MIPQCLEKRGILCSKDILCFGSLSSPFPLPPHCFLTFFSLTRPSSERMSLLVVLSTKCGVSSCDISEVSQLTEVQFLLALHQMEVAFHHSSPLQLHVCCRCCCSAVGSCGHKTGLWQNWTTATFHMCCMQDILQGIYVADTPHICHNHHHTAGCVKVLSQV